MINVLVTGIGGPTAQGIMRGLADKENIHIIGVDRREINSGIPLCDTFHKVPSARDEESAYKNAIKDIVEKENVDVIFPSLHEEISIYHQFRKELSAVVASPESEILPALTNKIETYRFLEETSLKEYVPKYFGFESSGELKEIIEEHFTDEKYIVAKQTSAHGALGYALLTDRETYLKGLEEGNKHLVPVEDYLQLQHSGGEMVMEYLDGQEFSVDIYVYEGDVIATVPRERSGVASGIVLDGKVVYNKELIDISSAVAREIIRTGFINLQFITKGDAYKLTDVNPRFCGSQIMSVGAGVNFPYLLIQYQLLNEYPAVEPEWGTRMIRFRDQFFIKENT
ncbi:ATP-grasp domain-containing protein [Evansella sp. LMS18]|uniref:ATP-grasp domain-containing protein n=1 Tax=Evansella sp. LMS18 TaxID=2924033 RepID=UPI0020D0257D|nr:ATP-grasp domain-containing protein [Evansella sp. LMS18]UTR12629.1 ATP-grasp domain-containing protein [Evansella sp. LMS18]